MFAFQANSIDGNFGNKTENKQKTHTKYRNGKMLNGGDGIQTNVLRRYDDRQNSPCDSFNLSTHRQRSNNGNFTFNAASLTCHTCSHTHIVARLTSKRSLWSTPIRSPFFFKSIHRHTHAHHCKAKQKPLSLTSKPWQWEYHCENNRSTWFRCHSFNDFICEDAQKKEAYRKPSKNTIRQI